MGNKINILHVGNLCTDRLIKDMVVLNIGRPNLAAQKYHKLFVQGMLLNSDKFEVNIISVPEFINTNKKLIRLTNPEIELGLKYFYAPIISIPFIRHIIIFCYLCFRIFTWWLKAENKNRLIVFDILNLTNTFTSLLMAFVLRIRSVAIVTDLPEMLYVLQPKVSILNKITYSIKNYLLSLCTGYVFLTIEMHKYLNTKNKPYCILEGMADNRLTSSNNYYKRATCKVIHYSGGLFEKFGVKALVDAFMELSGEDLKLHLFGHGDLVPYIKKCVERDSRIEFFGYTTNQVVLSDQLNSFLLVNPRFSQETYNKFSFPSKTIEYMVSGVPLLTTRLPGIPKEYFEFVYVFKEESMEGYRISIERILEIPQEELNSFGQRAKSFILANKNNKLQAEYFYKAFI